MYIWAGATSSHCTTSLRTHTPYAIMASRPLSHDEFFDKLGELLNHSKGSGHGAIYLTQKRMAGDHDVPSPTADNPFPDLDPGKPLPIFIRASNGKSKKDREGKIKIATVVQPDDLDAFYARYAEVCKAGMTLLKPRDRSKKKAKAKKKKATS
ncbi:Signal recognition particle subunit srp14 [Paramyrothecium foliicola]|nr:Signal recognition particle subunit srp14 [Paramyrothecium foliicola]